jgi:acyl carrier protein
MNIFELLPGDAQKNARAEKVFRGREPLDDRMLWERFFSQYGVAVDTVARVRKVLTTVLQTDLSRIRDSDDFSKELAFFWDWDSMADVETVQGLEAEFGITISDAEAEAMKTLKDIVLGVHEKIKNRG